nr:helix-turn-helix domain-containing protein [uncultured Moraxella sp.]
MLNSTIALSKAIKIAGGQTALAKKIGTKQQNIWAWVHRDKKASAKYVVKISEATGIPCYELRPDIFPYPISSANDDRYSTSPDIA